MPEIVPGLHRELTAVVENAITRIGSAHFDPRTDPSFQRYSMTLAGVIRCTIEVGRNFPKLDFVHTSHRAEFSIDLL
jgi:hypothetical protein